MDINQYLAKHLFDPILAYREKSSHRQWLEKLELSQYLDKTQIEKMQFNALKKLLIHSEKNVPFYSKRFKDAGFFANEIKSLSDIKSLPVLTKKDIQDNLETMKAKNINPENLISNRTGGSTGAPLLFYLDRERLYSRKAATIRHDRWASVDIGDKVAVLWGARADFLGQPTLKSKMRRKLLDRRMYLDTSGINRESMDNFVSELNRFRPKAILAYANSLFLFARYLSEKKIELHRPLNSIISSAELLSDDQRKFIEEVFGCSVFNRYGCRETSVVASECEKHNGMHICSETLFVEYIEGKIIITDLYNYGMPLIRYQIEDMGEAIDQPCDCGRGLPLMDIKGGRTTDFLVTPEGKVISGASLTIYFIANVSGVAQAQLIQKEKDRIIIKIVKGLGFDDSSIKQIDEKVNYFFGSSMKYELDFVENIEMTPSGKYRFSICELDPMEYLS